MLGSAGLNCAYCARLQLLLWSLEGWRYKSHSCGSRQAASALLLPACHIKHCIHPARRYGVKYPDLYATPDNCPDEGKRKAFNCVQRAHQNRWG